jgi:photosystem II stability/assembly factor-like uncharacterized protein
MAHKKILVIFLAGIFLLSSCSIPAVPGLTPSAAPTFPPVATQVPTRAPTATLPPVITASSQPTSAPTAAPTAAPTTAATTAPTAASTAVPGAIPHLAAGSDVTLTQVQRISKTEGWGIGMNPKLDPANEHVLRTRDGGATWQDVTPPQAAGSASTESGPSLKAAAFFLDAQHAWVDFSPQPSARPNPAAIWRTSDGGESWTASATLSQGSGGPEFFAPGPLTFLPDGKTGWLVVHAGVGMNHDYIYIFSTGDGGATWTLKVDPMDSDKGIIMSCYKSGLGFVSANSGWLAGSCNGVAAGVLLFHSADGGATWAPFDLPAPTQAPGIFTSTEVSCGAQPPLFFSAGDGLMEVTCRNFVQDKPAQTWLYFTADAGVTWMPRLAPASQGAFQFVNANEGWFVGDGQIFKTTSSGKTWAALTKVTWAGAQPAFLDTKTGWALAYSGQEPSLHYALVSSADGGVSWALITTKVK